jgi:hypothetical protein
MKAKTQHKIQGGAERTKNNVCNLAGIGSFATVVSYVSRRTTVVDCTPPAKFTSDVQICDALVSDTSMIHIFDNEYLL